MTEALEKETFSFQTEVGQLLEIVAGSLYSNREVFLRELVSNASDACDKLRYAALTDATLAPTQDFAITLEIGAKPKTLSISDNGIGIPEDEHINLFERFFRAQNVTNIQGTGLGLHIVKRYVDILGGEINFESKLYHGSRFTVGLPIKQIRDEKTITY